MPERKLTGQALQLRGKEVVPKGSEVVLVGRDVVLKTSSGASGVSCAETRERRRTRVGSVSVRFGILYAIIKSQDV